MQWILLYIGGWRCPIANSFVYRGMVESLQWILLYMGGWWRAHSEFFCIWEAGGEPTVNSFVYRRLVESPQWILLYMGGWWRVHSEFFCIREAGGEHGKPRIAPFTSIVKRFARFWAKRPWKTKDRTVYKHSKAFCKVLSRKTMENQGSHRLQA